MRFVPLFILFATKTRRTRSYFWELALDASLLFLRDSFPRALCAFVASEWTLNSAHNTDALRVSPPG
jgi:hypothetical protein